MDYLSPKVCHRDASAGARQLKLIRLTDFGLWFGKSIFESILAEVVQKEHLGHTAVTLLVCEVTCSRIRSLRLTFYKDVLELMVAVYCPDVTGVCKERTGPQQTYEDFYRSIHDRRCDTSDTDWDSFRQQLSSNIATSCERLRNKKAPELHRISFSTPYKTSMAPAPTSDAGSRASSSSSSSTSTSSLVSSHQQHSAESPSTIKKTGQHQSTSQSQASQPQALQPLANPAPAPQTAPQCTKCGHTASRMITSRGNSNGNALRPYYKCVPCDKFCCFDDLRGNDPTNPLCYCGLSGKTQASSINKTPRRQLYYVCRVGNCSYYEVVTDLNGKAHFVEDEVVDLMISLRLV
jgi:hypothetical protein